MYRYDEFDHQLVGERVTQFRGQVERRVSGELSEDAFKPLRLMNGVYLQLHAYMLRVAIPYGTLSSKQLRMQAHIARKYDRGYGHFTTRQNIQFNWPALDKIPDLLEELATVEMHAIQTSGNCIRNVTADQYAGAIDNEVEDPRIISEIIRQWSTFHPEFTYLPRKFKIAVTGHDNDRAAIKLHDIGIVIKQNELGDIGYEIHVGGGQGRTPFIAKKMADFVPKAQLLAYLEAVMRVYNRLGRRDNSYKARIKIMVHETGEEEMRRLIEAEFAKIDASQMLSVPQAEVDRISAYFANPAFAALPATSAAMETAQKQDADFARWVRANIVPHKQDGYAIVNISLKPIGGVPGDATDVQMEAVADLAERYSFDEIRVTHEQNLVLPHVRLDDLKTVYDELQAHELATANLGLISDTIACPGLDYCNLANARSIPLAQEISERFADLDRQYDIGELKIKISGCINACGHHHVGHIGILGVDKKGTEFYQISLGGSADENASIGTITGRAFTEETIVDAIETVVTTYKDMRQDGERFIDTYRRVGLDPFKERLYA
ncbi:MAG: nitrite/sulfite reductase [Rhodobiaceae bacterium]|jgi:sulfite reductase (NADPH) hemoprotein beta-component|nr:nitrite/sulfite reductase [Rhodobiaceae bacterium]MBT7280092.1 nitrite/sulfite reductase [Rhodobiaceae bacterium]